MLNNNIDNYKDAVGLYCDSNKDKEAKPKNKSKS